MLSLHEMQTQFAEAMHGDASDSLLAQIHSDRTGNASDRLAVYRNTVKVVLQSALRITYPVTEELVGEEFFAACATYYARESFPETAYLNNYGADFGDFLSTFEPAAKLPYLPDVAALEWKIAQSFNAPDVAHFGTDAFAQLSEAEQEALRFCAQPSLHLVPLYYPAESIWQAVRDKDEAALVSLNLSPKPHTVLVLRAAQGVTIQTVTESDEKFLDDLLRGVPLCQSLPPHASDTELALFAQLLAFNALCPLEISP